MSAGIVLTSKLLSNSRKVALQALTGIKCNSANRARISFSKYRARTWTRPLWVDDLELEIHKRNRLFRSAKQLDREQCDNHRNSSRPRGRHSEPREQSAIFLGQCNDEREERHPPLPRSEQRVSREPREHLSQHEHRGGQSLRAEE